MKVSFTQHGGMAAGINLRLPPKTVDTAMLGAREAKELERLVDAALAAPSPPARSKGARDAQSYRITVEKDGRETVLTQSDDALSDEFAKLLGWLQRYRAK
jgi:hypothetical protein